MAYVLGFLFSDGSMEDASRIRGKYLRVSSTDMDRIEHIRALLGSEHTIVRIQKPKPSKPQYFLRIGSQILYSRLEILGMTPRKSLTMAFPNIPKKYLGSFVLGYFDGDGCVYLKNRLSKRPTGLKTIFTSGSKNFLFSLKRRLSEEVGLLGGSLLSHGSSQGTYQLKYTARDSMRLFLSMYKDEKMVALALRRKYDIFMLYFKKLGIERVDFPTILLKKGPVVKG